MTQDGDHHGPSSIIFIPMIDQKSTDPMCILSTMNFVCTLAQRYSVVPVLTFDQPLYWKAMEIQASQESESTMKSCVLRLCGFHMCMSFLGAMQGSGLSSIFELFMLREVCLQLWEERRCHEVLGHIFCSMEH